MSEYMLSNIILKVHYYSGPGPEVGPPQGRGVRGAPSKNGGAGIPGLGPVPGPAKSGCKGSRQWLGWPKINKKGIFRLFEVVMPFQTFPIS